MDGLLQLKRAAVGVVCSSMLWVRLLSLARSRDFSPRTM